MTVSFDNHMLEHMRACLYAETYRKLHEQQVDYEFHEAMLQSLEMPDAEIDRQLKGRKQTIMATQDKLEAIPRMLDNAKTRGDSDVRGIILPFRGAGSAAT